MFNAIMVALGLVVGFGITLLARGEHVAGAIMVTGGVLGALAHISLAVVVTCLTQCANGIARAMYDRKQVVVQIDNNRDAPFH